MAGRRCNAASVAQYRPALVRLALRYNLRLDTLTLGVVGVGMSAVRSGPGCASACA